MPKYAIFISVVIVIFIIVIIREILARKNKHKYDNFVDHLTSEYSALRAELIGYINTQTLNSFLITCPIYELFEESSIDFILNKVSKKIDNKEYDTMLANLSAGNYQDNKKSILEASEKILKSKEAKELFLKCFIYNFACGLKFGEELEKQEIEYHKTYGQEPTADPMLHRVNEPAYPSEEMEEPVIEELDNRGIVEDYEEY